MKISDYTSSKIFQAESALPWAVCRRADEIVRSWIENLADDYRIKNGVAIHETATVEPGAVLKAPCNIGAGCFVAAGAYLRGGVWLEKNVIIGPS